MDKKEEYVGRKFVSEFRNKKFDRKNEILKEMISSAKLLRSYKLTPGTTGNISVNACGGMYIKAGGKSLGEMTRRDIVYVLDYNLEENKALVDGTLEPSSETPMHWLIYHKIPRASAIVHVHDYVVLENIQKADRLRIKITSREEEYGTVEQADEVIKALIYDDYVVIKNHGSLAVAHSIRDATKLVIDTHKRFMD